MAEADKDEQHRMLQILKDLALELGCTPTKKDYEQRSGFGRRKIDKNFGNYMGLLSAAGFEPHPSTPKRYKSEDVFGVSINQHLDRYRDDEKHGVVKYEWPSIAAISDIHWPFHCERVVKRFIEYVGDVRPDHVLIVGDAWDMYSHGKFPRSHNVFTPKEEESRARIENENFWREIKKRSPKSECTQLLGNHDVRPIKRTIESLPTIEHWIDSYFKSIFAFDGVKTIMDMREELILPGNIMVHHGYRSKLGDHRDFALMNAIVGHTHKPGVVWKAIRGGSLFELNCGLAGDPEAKGLTYTPQRITHWVHSFGIVTKNGPANVIV